MKAAAKAKKGKEERYDLISGQELEARQQVYLARLVDVHMSGLYMVEATNANEDIIRDEIEATKWDSYLRCDGIPKPYNVPAVRTFVAREQHFEVIHDAVTVDWRIGIDERSILTQNIFRKDKTRNTLKADKCPNLGLTYQRIIGDYLETIRRIERLLDNDIEIIKYPLQTVSEIIKVKSELEEEMDEIFDRYVYRIISADTAYMTTNDGRVEKYGYDAGSFRIDLWGLCNVPVRFKELDIPVMIADLEHCKVEVQIPLSILSHCLTLRGLHRDFDHLTPNAKSFEQVVTVPTDHLNAGIPDLEDCLINEWSMQTEISTDITKTMQAKIAEYLEAKDLAEQAAIDAKKKGADDKKKIKIPKVPKAPQDLPPNMFPDTYPLFLKQEQSQWVEFIDEFYHPSTLGLSDDEINLKDYIMLGGVYSLHFVERPKHYLFNEFNVSKHSKDRKLHILADLVADLHYWETESIEEEPPALKRRTTRFASKPDIKASPSRAGLRERIKKSISRSADGGFNQVDVLPYFHIKFKLPKHLCLWGEPLICHYEESDVEVPDDKPEITIGVLKEYVKDKKEKDVTPDILRESRTKSIRSRGSMEEQRRTGSVNVFRPSLSALLRNSKLLAKLNAVEAIPNFTLDAKLTKLNIRNLERYCMPRILSSFRFPVESRDVANEAEELKAQRNVLVRKLDNAADDIMVAKCDFNFEEQNSPERFFPVFDTAEDVDYYDYQSYFKDDDDPKTFFSLIKRFDEIKKKYISQNKQFLTQEFRIKFPPEKKVKSQMNLPVSSSRDKLSRGSLTGLLTTASKGRLSFDPQSSASQHKMESTIEDAEPKKPVVFEVQAEKEKTKLIKLKHWTTKHISKSFFDKDHKTLHVFTDRLGIFGLAYKRYEHFPFRFWSLLPNPEKEGEVIFSLDTQHVRVILYISSEGYRGYATDITTEYVSRPVKYIQIEKPIADYNEFKKILRDSNINIFANHDAGFYIYKGYFSQKHLAAELHTYTIMASYCMLLNFFHSSWNRLATRRNIVLCIKGRRDDDEKLTIRITPENATFVEIRELCSDDLDIFNLEYIPTWRNMQVFADLNYLIYSLYPHAHDLRNKDCRLFINLKNFLADVRPLSYA